MNHRILFVIDSLRDFAEVGPIRIMAPRLREAKIDVHLTSLAASPESTADLDWIELHSNPNPAYRSFPGTFLTGLTHTLQPTMVHYWTRKLPTFEVAALRFLKRQLKQFWTCFCRNERHGTLRGLMNRRLPGQPNCVIATNQSLVESIGQLGFDQSIEIIDSGIDHTAGDSVAARKQLIDALKLKDDSVLVGTVANDPYEYRLKDLVWAVDLLCCIRSDIHLIIFSKEMDSRLLRFIRHTEAFNNVHFWPTNNAFPIETTLAGLDIYWNAQLVEPSPFAMLDAMSNAIPTVSVFAEQTQSLVVPSATALATNFGARDEFARWTKFLIEQNNAAEQVKSQGRDFVLKKFPVETMVSKYLEIYNSF